MNRFMMYSVIVCLALYSVSGPRKLTDKEPDSSSSSTGSQSSSSTSTGYFNPRMDLIQNVARRRPYPSKTNSGSNSCGYYYRRKSDTSTSAETLPSTGYFTPKSDLAIDIESDIDSELQKRNACVKNIHIAFNQIQTKEAQVKYAISDMTIDAIKTTHGKGYFTLLHSYLRTDSFDCPNSFCYGRHIFSSEDMAECLKRVEDFGTSSEEALELAYFEFTMEKLNYTNCGFYNHKKDYMDYIMKNVEFREEPPNIYQYCFELFDYTNDKESDYKHYRRYRH